MDETEKARWHDTFVLGYHDRVCRPGCPNRQRCSQRWASFVPAAPLYDAAAHLADHPRDAAGARLILHDAMCMSGCTGDGRVGHAKRQTTTVAALRKAIRDAA